MVKISYMSIKKLVFRESAKNKSPISRILLFNSEIGQHELQTL